MHTFLGRELTSRVKEKLKNIPVVAILGPRQCGKSTLVKHLIEKEENTLYIDLERPSDLAKLRDPEAFLSANSDKLICLDEIQRKPDLFPLLRSLCDERGENGQYLILGSASPQLIKQSSETLAGRISYFELTPFLYREAIGGDGGEILRKLWLRGGFPRSYLASSDSQSYEWRIDFVRTFLERDIPNLGFQIAPSKLDRFWRMCAHVNGQLLNNSKLGDSLNLSHTTIRSYVDLLEQTFVIRTLPPYHGNLKKRLVKSPKIYIRDTGLLHTLLGIEGQNDLFAHPVYGSSWEGLVIENILSTLKNWRASFFRTSAGTEIDLILEKGQKRLAIECKASTSPELTRGFWNALDALEIDEAWVIAPVKEAYPIDKKVMVSPLDHFLSTVSPLLG